MEKKVAIVTGGGSGIGKAISERLIRDGAHVVIADISQSNIDATLKEFNAAGARASGRRVDVSKRDDIHKMAREVHAEFKCVDILVNNAGITRYTPFLEADDAAWDPVLNIDLKAVFFCV